MAYLHFKTIEVWNGIGSGVENDGTGVERSSVENREFLDFNCGGSFSVYNFNIILISVFQKIYFILIMCILCFPVWMYACECRCSGRPDLLDLEL